MSFATIGVGGAISAGAGILKGVSGLIQKGKANKALKNLKDPGYVIPEEYGKNLGEAENLAKTGMPSEQYNQAQTNIQRGSQTGLRQLGRMSNPFAAIQGLARGQQEAGVSLDVANAAARRQNILGAMGARREMAGQKLAQQQYAQQSYMDKVNQANALKGAGMQNIAGGLTSLGSVGMTAMSNQNMKDIYGNQNTEDTGTIGGFAGGIAPQLGGNLGINLPKRSASSLNASGMRSTMPQIGAFNRR